MLGSISTFSNHKQHQVITRLGQAFCEAHHTHCTLDLMQKGLRHQSLEVGQARVCSIPRKAPESLVYYRGEDSGTTACITQDDGPHKGRACTPPSYLGSNNPHDPERKQNVVQNKGALQANPVQPMLPGPSQDTVLPTKCLGPDQPPGLPWEPVTPS